MANAGASGRRKMANATKANRRGIRNRAIRSNSTVNRSRQVACLAELVLDALPRMLLAALPSFLAPLLPLGLQLLCPLDQRRLLETRQGLRQPPHQSAGPVAPRAVVGQEGCH